jgi:universal stress protein A
MAGYQHILFATDLADASERAGARAASLAECLGARLTLLHVVEHFPEDLPVETIPPEDVDPKAFLEQRGRERLEELARRLQLPAAEKRVSLTHTSARHEILRIVQAEGFDLLVLGGRGAGGTLGSTASGVVSASACDVLVVHS